MGLALALAAGLAAPPSLFGLQLRLPEAAPVRLIEVLPESEMPRQPDGPPGGEATYDSEGSADLESGASPFRDAYEATAGLRLVFSGLGTGGLFLALSSPPFGIALAIVAFAAEPFAVAAAVDHIYRANGWQSSYAGAFVGDLIATVFTALVMTPLVLVVPVATVGWVHALFFGTSWLLGSIGAPCMAGIMGQVSAAPAQIQAMQAQLAGDPSRARALREQLPAEAQDLPSVCNND